MSGQLVQINNIDIWYETFGNIKNPPVLLMMGNSCDAIMWPEQFCKELADKGLYVIRFDQRDTGLSTWFNFKHSPYTLLDMAADVCGLLDALAIPKAHIVGYSTGGAIAQLLAKNHPNRVSALTLMMTSIDLTIKNDAFAGKDTSSATLPPPKKEFIEAVLALNAQLPKNIHEKILQLVQNFSLANGTAAPFDKDFFYALFEKSMKRIEHKVSTESKIGHTSNHALASSATKPLNEEDLAHIVCPSLIIAGGQDPIFPPAHAQALAKLIPNSHLLLINRIGHILTPVFFEEVASAIAKNT